MKGHLSLLIGYVRAIRGNCLANERNVSGEHNEKNATTLRGDPRISQDAFFFPDILGPISQI